jgi:autotransporter-associated beta strand protein
VIKVTGNTNTGSYLNSFASNEVNVQAGGAKFDTNGNDIVIVQDLAGAGGFVKQGAGSLLLAGNTNYTGDTRIEGGALSFSFASINDGSSVFISTGGTIDLSTGGLTDSINMLYFNGVAQAVGTWGAIGSGAQFQSSFITGDGFLSVASVPEPGAVGLLVLGGFGLFLARRRKC